MATPEPDSVPATSPRSPSSQSSLRPPSDEKAVSASPDRRAPSAFEKLPDEIIEQILQQTDADTFASLVFLNSKWRRISQQPHLYAHHLGQCHSFATSHPSIPDGQITDHELPRLRRLFAREVKRNLFQAYLRPKKVTIKLISNSISSSSAPGGEGMQFSPSPRGHHLLAYNSARIYVLDLTCPSLAVKRELKIRRRPLSACILDDGSLLAVLSTDMQLNLYDMNQSPPRRKQSFILDVTPRAISFSPCGSVLAAAYEGGIEVSSLSPGAISTDRRAVKCDGVDTLAFSLDGTQLLGTTTTSTAQHTVILTAPYYDPGTQLPNDDISALWTTSILFPNASRDCSHAVLIQESSSMEAAWTFAYDRSFETFRAVRVDDLRNGTTHFTGPVPHAYAPGPLLPCIQPAANYQGELVAAGFHGKDIWLYGIPEDLEAVPDVNHVAEQSTSHSLNRRSSSHSARSHSHMQRANGVRVPQWQVLCDNMRNTFISGHMVAEVAGSSHVKWVSGFGDSSLQERLVITAKGLEPQRQITEEEGIDFLDGGRITILDFDYSLENGEETDITIEVGTKVPEVLEEEHRDMATEVAIVRRRTVAQRRGTQSSAMLRASTTVNRQSDALLRVRNTEEELEDPLVPRRIRAAPDSLRVPGSVALDDVSLEEAQEALDAPYTHASPRSGTTLRRAATAAAVSRQRNPPPPTAGNHIQYRRADGRAEHPHESDADNWVPPPPPYAKEDPGVDLPSYLRHTLIPGTGLTAENFIASSMRPAPRSSQVWPAPQGPSPDMASAANRPELPRIRTFGLEERPRRASETAQSREGRIAQSSNTSAQSEPQFGNVYDEDIYGASPLETPSPEDLPASGSEWMSVESLARGPPSPGPQYFPTEHRRPSSRSLHFGEGAHADPVQPRETFLSTPSSSANNPAPRSEQSSSEGLTDVPVIPRLPNPSTWPLAAGSASGISGSTSTGYPRSAPAANINNEQLIATSLPQRERPEQVAGIRHEPASAEARAPVIGTLDFSRRTTGDGVGRDRERGGLNQGRAPPPEQPLIISTPRGISGAYDEVQPRSANNTDGPVIHAPVPRHPHSSPGNPSNRPTAERLETITGTGSQGEPRVDPDSFGIPNASYSSFFRRRTSITRRPSRARRGAIKNLQDARERGWTGRKKKNEQGNDVASWTDIPPPDKSSKDSKDKKCIVM